MLNYLPLICKIWSVWSVSGWNPLPGMYASPRGSKQPLIAVNVNLGLKRLKRKYTRQVPHTYNIYCTYRHVCVTLKSLSYNRDHPRYNVSSKQQTAGDAAICPLDLHERPGHDAQGWGASILGHAPRCSQQGKQDMPRCLRRGSPSSGAHRAPSKARRLFWEMLPSPTLGWWCPLHRFLLPCRMCLSPFFERRLETLPPSPLKSRFAIHRFRFNRNLFKYSN